MKAMNMKTIGSVQTPSYGTASIQVGRYPHGGAIYVQLTCSDGEPLGTFSTNLVPYGASLGRDEFTVKNWAENEGLVDCMMKTGLFEDTEGWVRTGFVKAPIWRMRDPANVPA